MKLYDTSKKESRNSVLMRWAFNFWPCIWCTGSKIQFIAADYREMHVSLKLNIRTRNRVGTVFGGSIYSSVDPHFMLMFMQILGNDYVVWDKAATVKFVKPITDRVKCRFWIPDETVNEVKQKIADQGEYTFDLPLKYEDESGAVYAVFTKTVYAASKAFYKKKMQAKTQTGKQA